MNRLMTVSKAKEQINMLRAYIDLAETYEADTLEKLIIKEYAFTNSMAEVVRVLERRHIAVERSDVAAVIKSKPKDELHRMVRSGYMRITKHQRKRS